MTSNNSAKISSPTYWTVYDLDTLTVDKEKTDKIRDKSKERERRVSKSNIFIQFGIIYSSIKTDKTQRVRQKVRLWPRTEQRVVNW